LRRGDNVGGKQLLGELVRAFPDEAMADSARFELALLAKEGGRSKEARAHTREILRHGQTGPFVEPARFLRCRIDLDDDRDAAADCLARFVRDYPQSPHDAFALRALVELARSGGHCAQAVKFAGLYLQRHPQGEFAAQADRVRNRCED
jgi:TolA-binding protein